MHRFFYIKLLSNHAAHVTMKSEEETINGSLLFYPQLVKLGGLLSIKSVFGFDTDLLGFV